MAGLLTLKDSNSLDTLRAHWVFAYARLQSDPNAAPYLKDFKPFGALWTAADKKEMELEDAVTHAEAGAVAADGGLDALSDQVTAAIHGAKKVDISLPLHHLYYGNITPSQFKRPILGAQLERIHGWPALMTKATQPALKALGTAATHAVKTADGAAEALQQATSARDTWELGGERKKLFDTFNAMCAKAHGGLKAFAHEHAELNLPTGYADSFFQHSASAPHGTSVSDAAAEVAALQKKLAAAEKHHNALLAKMADREAAAAALHKAKADATAAKKVAQDALKAQKAAEADAKKKLKK